MLITDDKVASTSMFPYSVDNTNIKLLTMFAKTTLVPHIYFKKTSTKE